MTPKNHMAHVGKTTLTAVEQRVNDALERNDWDRKATCADLGCSERYLRGVISRLKDKGVVIWASKRIAS